jgi:hypothetical protein
MVVVEPAFPRQIDPGICPEWQQSTVLRRENRRLHYIERKILPFHHLVTLSTPWLRAADLDDQLLKPIVNIYSRRWAVTTSDRLGVARVLSPPDEDHTGVTPNALV